MRRLLVIVEFLFCLNLTAQQDTVINGEYNLKNLDLHKFDKDTFLITHGLLGEVIKLKLDINTFKKIIFDDRTIYDLTIKNCSRHCRYTFRFSYYNNVHTSDSIYIIDDGDSSLGISVNQTMYDKKGFRTKNSIRNSNTLKLRLVIYGVPDTSVYLNKIEILYPNSKLNPETGQLNKSPDYTSLGNSQTCNVDVKCKTGFDSEIKSVFLIASQVVETPIILKVSEAL
jgi:hypothetical protein